jgi:hypothetical protein
MHIRKEPSFFLTKIIGAPQGETLGLINPKSSISFNCICNSQSFGVVILYSVLEIGFAPGFSSMEKSSSLLGGNLDNSFGKTSLNYDNIGF